MATPSPVDLAAGSNTNNNSNNHDDDNNNNNETIKGDNNKYEEMISRLPKLKGCFGTNVYSYKGCYYRDLSLLGLMRMQNHFTSQSSDILLASFPKSGTTWLKALVFAILNRTRYKKEAHPLLTKTSHNMVPSLEMQIYSLDGGTSILENMSHPRLLSTHLHYTVLPKTITDSTCKIIYICRDPKDVFISFWHFAKKLPKHFANVLNDQFLVDYDLFCQGLCPNGSYWDHAISYWKASVENPHKVLFLKYEDLKKEPSLYVKKMAEFIDKPFSLEEEETGEVQWIVDLCSFEFLKNLEINKTGIHGAASITLVTNDAFYRKGNVGDWKNHLTPAMAKHLDDITKQKFNEYGLTL